jgi:hypothetical protein
MSGVGLDEKSIGLPPLGSANRDQEQRDAGAKADTQEEHPDAGFAVCRLRIQVHHLLSLT